MTPRFDGDVYEPERDDERLTLQLDRVHAVMMDGEWHTVKEIAARTGDPAPSVLAQIGHLRKQRFGAYLIERRRRGNETSSLWEYRLGPKGAGKPKQHTCSRSRQLLVALREIAPDHPLLNE